MENFLFHRHNKKGKPPGAKPLKDLVAVVTPSQLLLEGKRPELLEKIIACCALETARFDSLCLGLIHNVANHCQRLPETANSYYSQPGGLLDHALNRTEAALGLFREYVLLDGPFGLSEQQNLWLYALFSASILQGIGKLYMDFQVDLYDTNGQLLKKWNPVLENLASVGNYYDFEFQKSDDNPFRCRLNLLLARTMMPASGFSWIASNPDVFAIWLALLNEDERSAGTLGAILIRAEGIALQRYFNEWMIKNTGIRSARYNRISTFSDGGIDTSVEKGQALGITFIEWLNQALATGQVMINKAPLFMVPGGMMIGADIFKLFIRENPEFKNWQAIQNGFLSLELHSYGTDGSVFSRFEQVNTQQMLNGIVFSEYSAVLPEGVHVYNMNTGKVATMAATEFISLAQFTSHFTRQHHTIMNPHALQHLAASGQWQTIEPDKPVFQPGNNFSG